MIRPLDPMRSPERGFLLRVCKAIALDIDYRKPDNGRKEGS